jgi:hypothetical protein
MLKQDGEVIFVTIGVPFSSIPIMEKVYCFVDREENNTPIKVAKVLRKQVADNIENHGWVKGTKFTPAELYFEIYVSKEANQPVIASSNSRKVREQSGVLYPQGV